MLINVWNKLIDWVRWAGMEICGSSSGWYADTWLCSFLTECTGLKPKYFAVCFSIIHLCRCTIRLPDIFYQSDYSFMIEPDWKSIYGLSLIECHFIARNEIKTWFPFQFPFAFMTIQVKAWLTSFFMTWEEIYTRLIIKK